ncbi:hypothetical protein ABZZ44_07995 [Streptomyces sp. NPDC006460]|uniref:hypothetical protein n=1 Tax=Streptomyces sp. NPDC006460 TaxID=3154304 RepID=UPI0033A33276
MTTDSHHPASRITDALLPPSTPPQPPAPPAPGPRAAANPAPAAPGPRADGARRTASAVTPRADAPERTAAPPRPVSAPLPPEVAPPRPAVPLPAPAAPVALPPAPAAPPVVRPAGAPVTASAPSTGTPTRPARQPGTPAPEAGAPAQPSRPAGTPRPARQPGAPAPEAGTPGSRPPRPAEPPAVETTTRLRPVRDTDPAPSRADRSAPAAPASTAAPDARQAVYPRPASAIPFDRHPEQSYGTYGAYHPYTAPPETPGETTTRLRPIRERRTKRIVAAGVCLVLGFGLIGGAIAGAVLAATDAGRPEEPTGFEEARTLWHSVPVDTLFPRTLAGPGAGPGTAARAWTRVVVAPDAPCSTSTLPRSVLTPLRPVGCDRVLRATYTDATSSSVITVGLVFTQADPAAMRALGPGIGADLPPALAGPGTVAARFGDGQRASWWTRALPDLPVVVYSVSGFADGRRVDTPQPADQAMAAGQTTAPAEAGLGHEAKGVADRVERGLRKAATAAAKENDR